MKIISLSLPKNYPVTDNGFKTLKKYYGDMLNVSELTGKTVLDVGCGTSPFVKELRGNGINAVSLDVQKVNSPNTGSHIQGFANQMPFKDKVFDCIYSTFSIFTYLFTGNSKIQNNALEEIYRVLKPGGKARLYPVVPQDIKELIKKTKLPMKINKINSVHDQGEHFTVEILKTK